MWWKVLGASLVLLMAGMVTGYAVGESRTDSPARLASPAPVQADSPSYPLIPSVTTLPDPSEPALQVGVPSTIRHLSTGKHGNMLTVAIPDGWQVNRQSSTRWTWAVPGYPFNTYVMRIDVISGLHESVRIHKDARIAAYREAQSNGALEDFTVEDNTTDTFVATYVQNGYLRVTMERVLALGGTSAYADVAITGREADREGMMDLMARTTQSMLPE